MIIKKILKGSTPVLQSYVGSDTIIDYLSFSSLPRGLVSYYPFDSDGTDSVGSNDLGESSIGTAVDFTNPGKSGNSAYTNGTDECGLTGSAEMHVFADGTGDLPFSFTYYFYNLVSGNNEWHINKRDVVDRSYQLNTLSGHLYWLVFDTKGDYIYVQIVDYLPPVDEWVHIVVTYDGLEEEFGLGMNIYINGKLQTTSSNVGTGVIHGRSGTTYNGMLETPTGEFRIGDPQWTTTSDVNGRFDGLGVWNKELSAAEVRTIYNTQSGGNELI